MPYSSLQQEKWAHTPDGTKALGGAEKVSEWDNASKGKKLPKKIKKPGMSGGMNSFISKPQTPQQQ